MAEALSQGKPVVATNWSSNTEFCFSDTAWPVPYKMVPIQYIHGALTSSRGPCCSVGLGERLFGSEHGYRKTCRMAEKTAGYDS